MTTLVIDETQIEDEVDMLCEECGTTMTCASCDPESLDSLNKDLKDLARVATRRQARFLVDNYYVAQKNRIRVSSQIRACKDRDEPYELSEWNLSNCRFLENQLAKVLDEYSDSQALGRWARSIHGIGPVITAGLLAHIDLEKAKTPAGIWRFAGLDPTAKCNKNEKRPWNTKLKTLCFKIASSFEKVQNSDKDYYGHMLANRKRYEISNNESGKYEETAKATLATGSYKTNTIAKRAYESGKLPDGHIHARAKRYAVKLFLSHWHDVAYRHHYKQAPPLPYPIAHMGHTHFRPAPLVAPKKVA